PPLALPPSALAPRTSHSSHHSTTLPISQMSTHQTSHSTLAAPPLSRSAPHTSLLSPVSLLLYALPPLPSAPLSTPTCTSRTPIPPPQLPSPAALPCPP